MKNLRIVIGILVLGLVFAINGYSRTVLCNNGRINGIIHTSCFPWDMGDSTHPGDGKIPVSGLDDQDPAVLQTGDKNNDTARLNYIFELYDGSGKIVFDEAAYYIKGSLRLTSFRTVIGTGRASVSPFNANYSSSRIYQTLDDAPIFTISGSTNSVAVRDIALIGAYGTSGTIGIKAENGATTAQSNYQSLNFEFTNITFSGLSKGIYVNAKAYGTCNPSTAEGCIGYWRFDNVKLDHAQFDNCKIGVHVNSNNSGWSMKNIRFFIPVGTALPKNNDNSPKPIDSDSIGSLTFGVYLERVGYSTLDLLINDGVGGTGLVYVGQHANLNIQSSIDEGLKNSYFIYGGNTDSPVTLTNNTIQAPLTVRGSTVVSTGNQFSLNSTDPAVPDFAKAIQGSRIYSFGDKFCRQVGTTVCTADREEGYQADNTSEIIFSSNRIRIGPQDYAYKVSRNAYNGILEFVADQGTGIGGGNTTPGYAGYSFNTAGGTVQVNYDGSVSFGTKTYSQLLSNFNLVNTAPPPDGTVVFCSDCLKTTPCSAGTSSNGAMAKRLHGTWDCD